MLYYLKLIVCDPSSHYEQLWQDSENQEMGGSYV